MFCCVTSAETSSHQAIFSFLSSGILSLGRECRNILIPDEIYLMLIKLEVIAHAGGLLFGPTNNTRFSHDYS